MSLIYLIENQFKCGHRITFYASEMSVFGPNRFVWPEKDDADIIPYSTILAVMKTCPDLVAFGRRAVHSIPVDEFNRILNLYISLQ